jgi:C_GCAxxG_C_C family probable redox protein
MEKSEQAAGYMRAGFNCAQSVVKTFAPEAGAPEVAAVRMAASFGGGMGRNGLVCGAVTGAAIILGARYGFSELPESGARDKAYDKVNALIEQFQKENGSVLCRELLSIDPKNPEDWKRARDSGAFINRCPLFVQSASRILEALLKAE